MANKYLNYIAGVLTQIEALVTSAGAADAGKIVALDGDGKLDSTVMPVGIGADTMTIQASENLAAGDLVNVHDVTGANRVRKADASNARRADGFVLSSVTSGQDATVYFEGAITGLSGLTIGATYFLSGATAGAATAIAPSTSAYIVQEIGRAVSTSRIAFEPQQPITLA